MAERQKAVDSEIARQNAVQNELALLDYWQREQQLKEIEPSKFPHLDRFEVALIRFSTADSYANSIQTIRHIVVDPGVQKKLDILTTSIYRESEEKLNQDLGDIEGDADPELIRRRAALVISSDFNSSLDRAIKDGDEVRIDRSNFPGLRAVDDTQILQYKLAAIFNKIGFLENMIKALRPQQLGFNRPDEGERTKQQAYFERRLAQANIRLLELSRQFQQTAD